MPQAIPFFIGLGQAILIGAAVGAVVGGISSAISGGSIGQGMLHGAIGGAVVGALTFGVGTAFNALGTANANLVSSGGRTGMFGMEAGALGDGAAAIGAGEGAATLSVAEGAALATVEAESTSFLGGLWTDLKGSFSGGEGVGVEFGKAAVGAGIKGAVDVYGTKKTLAEAKAGREQGYIENAKTAELQHGYRLEEIAAQGAASGSAAAASGPDYTNEQLIERQRQAELGGMQTQLAVQDANLQGQKDLNQQEFDQNTLARERAAAGALQGNAGRVSGSRSSETLVAAQDRIRAGEGTDGTVNTGVIPPVTYVPPEQMVG
jgi:hypothetical protein